MSTRTLRDDGKVVLTFTATETITVPEGSGFEGGVRAAGGGGKNGVTLGAHGGGGGGGGFSMGPLSLTPGTSITVTIGAAGLSNGGSAADSHIVNAATLMAKGGAGAPSQTGGQGGQASAGVGATKFSGGNGATNTSNGGGGGGGAGDAANGGNGSGVNPGAGGSAGGGAGGRGADAVNLSVLGVPPGGGGGGGSNVQTTGRTGGAGEAWIAYTEAGVQTTVIALTQRETIVDSPGNQTVVLASPGGRETIGDIGGTLAVLLSGGAEALAERLNVTAVLVPSGSDGLAERQNVTGVLAFEARESLVAEGDQIVVLAGTGLETLAERQDVMVVLAPSGADGLAERQNVTALLAFTANWQRVAPGLSGTVYDESGTSPIAGAQVLLFRDDNTLIETLVSDGSGQWATTVDAAFQYWVSGWLDGATQIEDETDRHISAVLTVVETGT